MKHTPTKYTVTGETEHPVRVRTVVYALTGAPLTDYPGAALALLLRPLSAHVSDDGRRVTCVVLEGEQTTLSGELFAASGYPRLYDPAAPGQDATDLPLHLSPFPQWLHPLLREHCAVLGLTA